MQYRRCKCGSVESWHSGMPTYDCQGCEKCNTTLSGGPNGHKELQPHLLESHKETYEVDGKVIKVKEYQQCKVCRERVEK